MMELRALRFLLGVFLFAAFDRTHGQATVTARIDLPAGKGQTHAAPSNAVLWLEPLGATPQELAWPAHPPYRLLQKNRTFSPHVLVVPVGASVAFPNADPYFHNVFSLFEGSRFDLGLYEAGSTREVRFGRKGISYIFCNIHPEMGAVVLSLDTPLWSMLAGGNLVTIRDVPGGTYVAHLWVEGQEANTLMRWAHTFVVPSSGTADAGTFHAGPRREVEHLDKFGHAYKKAGSTY